MGEHNHGGMPTFISIIFGSLSIITLKDVQTWFSIGAGGIAIVAGCYAIYSHRLNIKAKKSEIEEFKRRWNEINNKN